MIHFFDRGIAFGTPLFMLSVGMAECIGVIDTGTNQSEGGKYRGQNPTCNYRVPHGIQPNSPPQSGKLHGRLLPAAKCQ
jgi:hypothetical protein